MKKRSSATYRVRHGFRLRSLSRAREWGKELVRLNGLGKRSPREIVAAAKSKTSPLHDYFDWNDTRAAEAWRIEQAKYLLRAIEIRLVAPAKTDSGVPITYTRAIRSVATPDDRAYRTAKDIRASKTLSMAAVDGAMKELIEWRDRFQHYADVFGPVFDAIYKVELIIKKRRGKRA